IGDYQNRIANRLYMLYENSIDLDETRAKMIFKLHSLSVELFNDISRAVKTGEKELYSTGLKKYQELKSYYKEVKREHFSRSENIPARLNTGYLDIINYYKRIADHTYNIIEYVMKI
ncbi:MAG: Na/Pi cotransporter family protein, partial [Fusobacterium periodonticum]|nr:Na/Pi cotransporter family protein [Fusobacterium periodonticum]